MAKSGVVSASHPTSTQGSRPAPFTVLKAVAFTSLMLSLVACGGGGGGDSPNFGGTSPLPAPSSGGSGGTGGTPVEPVYKIGTGSGSTYQDAAINASQTELDAGETATLRVNVVNQNNEPPTTTVTVTFSSICSANGLATFGTQSEISPGLFSVNYTNNGCDGADTVTATLFENGDTATVAMTMIGPEVLTVSFVSSTQQQLSLAGIGGNESTELTFKVAGPQGVPIIGKQVGFSINTTVGGASILAGRETGITDQAGLVRTILNSGTVAGPVNVLATHLESGRQGLSSDIIISTGVPVSSRFSLSYQPHNPLGAWNTDGIEVTVSIIASDVFGNNPTDGTRVSFVASESGNITNSCEIVDGFCSVTWRSTTPRPLNGRLEVIAYTDGAEDFVDTNGNSVYDSSDTNITDLGEPYADENENDTYDLGEFFFDTDRDGVRDGGNGLWDGPCLSRVNAAAVCTGNDTVSIFGTATIVMPTDTVRILSLGTFPPVGTTINLPQGGSVSFSGMIFADNNTNADSLGSNPPPFGTTISFAIDGPGAVVQGVASDTVVNTTAPVGPYAITVAAAVVDPANPLPVGARLVLTTSIPGRSTQEFSWPVNIAR
jgi:hypothetical protein